MGRTVVAIRNEKLSESISGILTRSGIDIRAVTSSGRETIRTIKRMDGGVIVTTPRLGDMNVDELAEILGKDSFFLVLGKPIDLDYCENEGLFKVPLPVKSGELIGSLNILLQLDARAVERRVPKRSDSDKHLINQAKKMLMYQQEMTEDEAYRFIQKHSMETSTPMTEVAKIILSAMDA